jgi:hypothetical protein
MSGFIQMLLLYMKIGGGGGFITLFSRLLHDKKCCQYFIMSSLQLEYNQNGSLVQSHVRFEVITVVTMKNAVYWDVTSCGSCKNNMV